jgi:hypothetical protein
VTDSGQVRRRDAARLLVSCLLVLGLFLMHGAPASAAGGCHGSTGASPGMSPGHHGTSPAAGAAATGAFHHPEPSGHTGASAAPGRSCVATPAHEQVRLPAPALLAVTAVAVLLSAAGSPHPRTDAARRRGPPAGGRQHLLLVCIART